MRRKEPISGLPNNWVRIRPLYPNGVGESGTHYLYDLKGKITGSDSFGDNPLGLMVSKFELNATENEYQKQVIGITLACQGFMDKILNKADSPDIEDE